VGIGVAKILGPQGVGMLTDGGKLTKAARDKFTVDVLSLLAGGNEDGTGLQKTSPLFVLPCPPIPGPDLILSIVNPEPEKLFWFKPEPLALLATPIIIDPEKAYQKLIVDTLYEPLVKMMNLDGKPGTLGPVIDPTIAIDLSKFPNAKIPDLPKIMADIFVQVTLANVPNTAIAAKLKLFKDFGIGDPIVLELIPLLTKVPDLTPPSFNIPSIPLPPVPNLGIPSFVLPDLMLGLFSIPLKLIGKLIGMITSPGFDPLEILLKIIKLIIEIILALLQALGLLVGLPKLLSATIAVIIKNMAGMLLCDVIGSLLGTGLIVKIVGTLVGLT
jgi:hypothetical protein